MKRVIASWAALCIFISGTVVWGEDALKTADMEAWETSAMADDSLPARSAILIEQETGRVLFEKNSDEKMQPASITKVMTLLLTMEAIDSGTLHLTDIITCSEYAASMGGSQIWLEPGEEMSIDDLLKATSIASANDAAVVLAEAVAGSEDAFVALMNKRAEQLEMTDTNFINATGLDISGHVSSARDIATMSRELLQYPLISEYSSVWMSTLRGGETQLVNTNKLVRFYDGCTGLKTGTTDGAGSCLSASAKRKGMGLIAVTLGSSTSEERFSAARGLLDYGFANYKKSPVPPLENIPPVKVKRGVTDTVEITSRAPESVLIKAGQKVKLSQEVDLTEEVEAPVERGQKLGCVRVKIDDEILLEYDLLAGQDVARMTTWTALKALTRALFMIP